MNMKNDTFGEIAGEIRAAGSILIIPHEHMDGDAAGSAAALCLGLRKLGKQAQVVLEDRPPENLAFLTKGLCVPVSKVKEAPSLAICVDCSDLHRFPKREKLFCGAGKTICLDHHKAEQGIADLNHIDDTAAASAELMYFLLRELDVAFDEAMALRIYAGLATDTGNFLYSNTTAQTHEIAAAMMRTGMDSNEVNVMIYESESFAKMRLHAAVLAKAECFAGGMGIMGIVSQEDLASTGARMEDTEGLVAALRSIRGVEIAVLLKEQQGKVIKASLRAKTFADVQKICAANHGGGHVRASGCTIYDTLPNARRLLLAACEKELQEYERNH